MDYLVAIIVGYLIGAFPVGLLLARLVRGVDIREHGSGKLGSTNVLRTVGRPAALLVLLLDMGKTVGAVLIVRAISAPAAAELTVALAVLVGHNWPVFTGFKGGRGTAPGLGGLIILSPWATLSALALGVPSLLISRYVSLGSLVGAVSGGLTIFALGVVGVSPLEHGIYGLVGALFIVFSHRDNIARIVTRTERKLGAPVETVEPMKASGQRGA